MYSDKVIQEDDIEDEKHSSRKIKETKDKKRRSKSKERRRDRSRSKDRKRRKSRSNERTKERRKSRSKERERIRRKSKERRERSKSREDRKNRKDDKSKKSKKDKSPENVMEKTLKPEEDNAEETTALDYNSDEFIEMLPKSKSLLPNIKESDKENTVENDIDAVDAYMSTLIKTVRAPNTRGAGEFTDDHAEDIDGFQQPTEPETLESITQSLFEEKRQKLPDLNHEKIYYRKYNFNLYKEVPEIANMTVKEVKELRRSIAVVVKGKDCPKPITKWSHAIVSMKILNALRYNKMFEPTPIQSQTIPAIMCGKDVIGIAKTGSGKTLAYLLPLIRHIHNQPSVTVGEGPIAIVLCPTRELSIQIHQEIEKITFKLKDVNCGCIYGGADVAQQISRLKRGVEIVVGTPGRIIDIMATNGGRNLSLGRCTFIVLDEADRMFDMGFEPQVMAIISRIRPDRQTVMFSATFPRRIEAVAKKIMKEPLEVRVDGGNKVCTDVLQQVFLLEEDYKFLKLVEILREFEYRGKGLVFVEMQETAQTLFKNLDHHGFTVTMIHGGLSQEKREEGMFNFKSGSIPILIATSIAARGLDVVDLMMVVNYDCPNHYEDYVHRCGRTGRAGNKGYSYTFVTADQEVMIGNLIKALKENGQEVATELTEAYARYSDRMKSEGKSIKAPSGFRGHGFKFDAAEAMKEKGKKLLELKEYCPDEITEEDEAVLEEMQQTTHRNVLGGPQLQLGAIAGQQSAVASFEAQNHAKAAHQMAMKLNMKLDNSGSAAVPDSVNEVTPASREEIPINALPANIRYLLTTRDLRTNLSENYDVALTVKGVFMAPKDVKRLEQAGEKQLHLLLESDSPINIRSAKSEILRVVKSAMNKK